LIEFMNALRTLGQRRPFRLEGRHLLALMQRVTLTLDLRLGRTRCS
jgi:hypothetical protein